MRSVWGYHLFFPHHLCMSQQVIHEQVDRQVFQYVGRPTPSFFLPNPLQIIGTRRVIFQMTAFQGMDSKCDETALTFFPVVPQLFALLRPQILPLHDEVLVPRKTQGFTAPSPSLCLNSSFLPQALGVCLWITFWGKRALCPLHVMKVRRKVLFSPSPHIPEADIK